MHAVDVTRPVDRAPNSVFDYLLDFPAYGDYARPFSEITRMTGGPSAGAEGVRYEVTAGWKGINGTVGTEVTAIERPERIAWRVTDNDVARGAWHVLPGTAATSAERATRIELSIRFDPAAIGDTVDSLPGVVPLEAVLGRLQPTIEAEAERVLERIVADLEAESG